MNLTKIFVLFILLIPVAHVCAGDVVKIHAPTKESFSCTEHWDGQFQHLGDALGTDCVVQELYKADGRMFMKSYKNDGFQNEDWYGYGKKVLAPCDCEVVKIHENETVNQPGKMTPGRAGSITFKKEDGTMILVAHIVEPKVSEGDSVKAGNEVAKIGNNGYSRNPHIHIAAWKDSKPLQIRFDQKTLSLKLREELNSEPNVK